ncbi:MAG: cytochrome c [Candidatus Binatia bacterium]
MKKSVIGFGALLVAGWLGMSVAHEHAVMHVPDAKDAIAFRHYLMENIGDNAKELNDKVKAGNMKAAKVNAQAIALHATRVVDLFPPGSVSDTSRAKEEIWQKWEDFVKLTDTFRTNTDALTVALAEGKDDEAKAQLKNVFANCKSCHTDFRKPDKDEQKG